LIVDSNRKLSGAIAFKRFQPIAGQCRQIGQARRRIQPIQTYLGLSREAAKLLDRTARSKPLGAPVSVANDHGRI
jgi:hypothetical protein